MSKTGNIILGIFVAIVAVILFSTIGAFSYVNSIRNEGVGYESQLNAQYLSNQNYLSSYISGFYEQTGLVKYKSEKLDQILSDYAKGRSGGSDKEDRGNFINAVHEAAPDLSGLNIADKMLAYVSSGRAGYRDKQDQLLDLLRSYDKWRNTGIFQSMIIKNVLNYPSDNLEARIGTTVVRGSSARDKMYEIVLAPQAKTAYQSGEMTPLSIK
jgi:hypothetical protein